MDKTCLLRIIENSKKRKAEIILKNTKDKNLDLKELLYDFGITKYK